MLIAARRSMTICTVGDAFLMSDQVSRLPEAAVAQRKSCIFAV
jgi:hypothetical protein